MDASGKTVSSIRPPASCGATRPMQTSAEPMRKRKSSISDLHAQVSNALRLGRVRDALDFYELIEKRKPKDPRWSHRKAELLHRMGRDREAVTAYKRAVDLYAEKGFDALASATAKLMRQLESKLPTQRSAGDVQSRPVATHRGAT